MSHLKLSRRQMLLAGSATAVAAGLNLRPVFAKDALRTYDLGGGVTIRTLSDGYLMLPQDFPAPDVDAAQRKAAMAKVGQTGDTYKSPINVVLISTPTDKIMVDVGSGARFMATAGALGASLDDAGIEREAITKVIFTHAHPDHIWGIVDDFDEIVFPEATFHMSEPEYTYWSDEKTIDTLPEDRKAFAVGAKRSIETLDDLLERHPAGSEIAPGVSMVETFGHTPGHQSVRVTSGDKTFMVLGDALSHPVISFQHPEWQPAADHVKDQAVETRKRLLDQLATDKIPFCAYHLPKGGMGHAVKSGSGYAFESMA